MADSTGRTAALGWVDQRRLWAGCVDPIIAFVVGAEQTDDAVELQTQHLGESIIRLARFERLRLYLAPVGC